MTANILIKQVVGTGQVQELRGGAVTETIGPTTAASGTLGPLQQYTNFVARQAGKLWTINGANPATIDYYDPDTDSWVTVHTITGTTAATINCGLRGFEAVTGIDGRLYLVAIHKDFTNNRVVFIRLDDTGAVTEFPGAAIANIDSDSYDGQPIAYKNKLYFFAGTGGASGDPDRFCSFEPSVGTIATYAFPPAGSDNTTNPVDWQRLIYFSHDDRLFMIAGNKDNHDAYTWEFKFGGWVAHTGVNTRHFFQNQNSQYWYATAFYYRGAAYLFYRTTTGGAITDQNSGISCWKSYVPSAGANPIASYITDPVIPASMRAGQNIIGDSRHYGLWSFVDDQTDPANPVPYIIFVPDIEIPGSASLFRFSKPSNDPSINDEPELEYLGEIPANTQYAFPDTYWGAGAYLNGRETANAKLVTTQILGSQKGTQGVLIDFRAYGDPLVVPHNTVSTPTIGPFEAGETVTSSSGGSATILESRPTTGEIRLFNVTGNFNNGDTLTQTTGTNVGTTAIQNADSSGGLADKTVRFRYFLNGSRSLGTPSTGICTLVVGTNTDGTLIKSPGADEIQNLKAEHLLDVNAGTFQVEWDFLADGIAEAATASIKAEIVRP